MADYDFFELTGISLTEKSPRKVESQITRKKTELQDKLGAENQDTARRELEAQIRFLEDIQAKVINAGKLTSAFSDMARQKTELLKRRLTSRVLLEKSSRKGKELIITNGKIKKLRNNREHGISLSIKEIEQVYIENGFKIETVKPSVNLPQIPDRCAKIHAELDAFRIKVAKAKKINTALMDAGFVQDLYTFTSYICGDYDNAQDYKTFSPALLKAKLEPYLTAYSGYSSETIEKSEANIAGQAVSFIFDNDAHNKGYQQFLLLNTPELVELFANMKGLLEADLRDPDIAELCIKKISEVFGDYDTALAIYNDQAGLKDPYIPDRPIFAVRCAHCQAVCEFTSLKDAQKQNKCTNCGQKIFKPCPSCKKLVLYSLNKCPECNYDFPDVNKFNKFIVMAENSLRMNNFADARNFLAQARIADTTEKDRTRKLEAQISQAEEEYNKPLTQLNDLIKALKLEEASRFAENLAVTRPEIDTKNQRRKINDTLEECRRLFKLAGSKTEKINACIDILKKCADFSQAVNFLASNPPSACSMLNVLINDEDTSVLLSWPQTGEREITYTLIRKKGSRPPTNENDGTVLISGTKNLSFKDTSIEPGIIYSYSIFTKRHNLYSSPSIASAVVLSKVSEIQHNQKGNVIFLSWKAPKNSSGVRVCYQYGGFEHVLSENAINSVTLENIKLGGKYIFLLSAIYPGLGRSGVAKIEVVPGTELKDFKISSKHLRNNIYEISWDIQESGIDVQVLSGSNIIHRTRSEMKSCQITLAENFYHKIKVCAVSGGKTLYSLNEIKINTLKPCIINERETKLEEVTTNLGTEINITIALAGNIPGNLKYFATFTRTDSSPAKWASQSEALIDNGSRIIYSAEQVRNRGGKINKVIIPNENEKFYITLFAVYEIDGIEIASEACCKTFTRPLSANIFWSVSKTFFGMGRRTLNITTQSNRPISRRPGLILCKSLNNSQVLNPFESNAFILMEIAPKNINPSSSEFNETFDILANVTKGQQLFLFVKESSPEEMFSQRWAKGFDGKA